MIQILDATNFANDQNSPAGATQRIILNLTDYNVNNSISGTYNFRGTSTSPLGECTIDFPPNTHSLSRFRIGVVSVSNLTGTGSINIFGTMVRGGSTAASPMIFETTGMTVTNGVIIAVHDSNDNSLVVYHNGRVVASHPTASWSVLTFHGSTGQVVSVDINYLAVYTSDSFSPADYIFHDLEPVFETSRWTYTGSTMAATLNKNQTHITTPYAHTTIGEANFVATIERGDLPVLVECAGRLEAADADVLRVESDNGGRDLTLTTTQGGSAGVILNPTDNIRIVRT